MEIPIDPIAGATELAHLRKELKIGKELAGKAIAEIKRLETELDKAEQCAVTEIAKREQAEAQLAEMRIALECAQERLNWYAVRDTQDPTSIEGQLRSEKTGRAVALIEQVLTANAGKAAADVLAAADDLDRSVRKADSKETLFQVALGEKVAAVCKAVRAYRNEGREDG